MPVVLPLRLAGETERTLSRAGWVGLRQHYHDRKTAFLAVQGIQVRQGDTLGHLGEMGIDPLIMVHAMKTLPDDIYLLVEDELTGYRDRAGSRRTTASGRAPGPGPTGRSASMSAEGANVKLRKLTATREVLRGDVLGEERPPVTRAVAMAVFRNPYAGRFEQDLSPLFQVGHDLGEMLAAEALALLANPAVSYGKAALVGIDGEMEHGAALIHPRLGAPMRAAIGGGAALIPSNAKVAVTGTVIDIPLGHKDDPWSRDHFDTMTVAIPDAPRPDEIVLCVAYADGGRPHPRSGQGPARK